MIHHLYHLIQHKNGYIRHAAVRMLENELGPLTVHIRYPNKKFNYTEHISPQEADRILFEIHRTLMSLLNYFWKPAYKKYKYIPSIPSSPYKSIQMMLSCLEDDCGNKYIKQLEQQYEK